MNLSNNASSSNTTPEVRLIETRETLPVRLAILRPGLPEASAIFPGDDDPGTKHFGAFQGKELVGVASLFTAELPGGPKVPTFQLRGMATAEAVRGLGFGKALVFACLEFARNQSCPFIWCNARTEAVNFYKKLGFEILGDEFEIPGVGPHFRMRIDV